jgi:hypothetical protein
MKALIAQSHPSQDTIRNLLKSLSPKDFLNIGMNEIAYVRPILMSGKSEPAYGVYAADGTQLSVLDNMDMAMATLRHNDLMVVTLH